MKSYNHILEGYYDSTGKIKAVDIKTNTPYFIEDRPDMKQRVEQALTSKRYLGIYQRGSRNGFNYINREDIDLKITEKTFPKETNMIDKPSDFIISDLKWKYLTRCMDKGKNLMFTGSAGTGKTQIIHKAAELLDKPLFYFNLGSTQEVRSTLIGNTFFDGKTYFDESMFVKAIKTPNAVVLLDEISRANPEAWNILMPVLDVNIRKLRLDEAEDSPEIKVADGVCFLATANIGFEYTSTRSLDRALMDRFSVIEMDVLNKEQEMKLLGMNFPELKPELNDLLCSISDQLKKEVAKDDSTISTHISTRLLFEIASLLQDDFTIQETLELLVYPLYSSEGGAESERTYVRMIIQKFLPSDNKGTLNDTRNGKDNMVDRIFAPF
jgi:MoxR-like ATPase